MRLHVTDKHLVVEPDHGGSGNSLWVDRDKSTMSVRADRVDVAQAKTEHIQCIAGVIKCGRSICLDTSSA